MKKYAFSLTVALVALTCASMLAQTADPQSPPLLPTVDPGVARASLMDRAEIRVLRVEIQPGAVRTVHTHDEVRYQLFIPLTPDVELTIGSAKPVPVLAGHVVFLEKGTPHGFRNTGSSVAKVLEVFVKPDKPNTPVARTGDPAADKGDAEMLARALALVNTAPSEK
jgi:quercetin dioxygenase-like cupin family protein